MNEAQADEAPARGGETARGAGNRRRFAADALLSLGGTWASFVIGAMGGLVLTRALLPEGKGIYAALFTVGLIGGTVGNLGVDIWVTRRAATVGPDDQTRSVIRRHLSVVGLVGFAMLIVALLLPIPGGSTNVSLAIVNAITASWFAMIAALYRGLRTLKRVTVMQLTVAIGFLVIAVALRQIDQLTVTTALLAPCLLRVAAIATPFTARLIAVPSAAFTEWFSVVRANIGLSLGQLAEFVAYRADILFVGVLLGATELGIYSAALPLSELLWLLPNAIAHVLLPHIASSQSIRTTTAIARITTTIAALGAILLSLTAAPLVVFLYGPAFAKAAQPLAILLVAAVLLSLWKIITVDLVARGDTMTRTKGAVLAMIALGVTLPPLTNSFGLRGAAAATVIGYGLALGHGLTVWSRLEGARVRDLLAIRRSDVQVILSSRPRRSNA